MSSWSEKFNIFKSAIDKDKAVRLALKSKPVCIHGDENCVRCAQEDFEQVPVSQWTKLEESDLRRVVNSLPADIILMMKRSPSKVTVAGGFIRAIVGCETVKDIDVFVPSRTTTTSSSVITTGVEKDKTFTYKDCGGLEVQFIWRYNYTEPIEVPNDFDYTVVKAAVWYSAEEKSFVSVCHERFYRDLARKMLVYVCERGDERLQSIPRLMRYARYGYSIDPKSLATIMTRTCLSLDLSNGLDGLQKQFENVYLCDGTDLEWTEKNKPYTPPRIEYSGS